jgi:ABC-type transporter lipoprotein component MlaA
MNPYVYITDNTHRAHNHHRQQRIWLKALYGIDAIDTRRELLTALNELERLSPDYYVGLRSAYFQKQAGIKAKIDNRKSTKE